MLSKYPKIWAKLAFGQIFDSRACTLCTSPTHPPPINFDECRTPLLLGPPLMMSSAAELFSLRYFLDFLNSKNPKKSSFVFPWVMMFVRSFECPQSSINLNMHISFECQFSIRFFDTFSTLSSFQNRIRVSLSSISFGQRVSKEEGGEDHILAFVALLRCRFLFVISRLVYNNETLILDFEILFRLKKMRWAPRMADFRESILSVPWC